MRVQVICGKRESFESLLTLLDPAGPLFKSASTSYIRTDFEHDLTAIMEDGWRQIFISWDSQDVFSSMDG